MRSPRQRGVAAQPPDHERALTTCCPQTAPSSPACARRNQGGVKSALAGAASSNFRQRVAAFLKVVRALQRSPPATCAAAGHPGTTRSSLLAVTVAVVAHNLRAVWPLVQAGVPAVVLAATQRDELRKPERGMWDFYVERFLDGQAPGEPLAGHAAQRSTPCEGRQGDLPLGPLGSGAAGGFAALGLRTRLLAGCAGHFAFLHAWAQSWPTAFSWATASTAATRGLPAPWA